MKLCGDAYTSSYDPFLWGPPGRVRSKRGLRDTMIPFDKENPPFPIHDVEVRLDAWTAICVELFWDGGTSWTAANTSPTLGTTETTFILGGQADSWGRTWSNTDFTNANFRVRLIDIAGSAGLAKDEAGYHR